MEVTQITGSDQFAILGGGKTRAFKMGENASAFRILSDTLYSNKIRAVVREIICNAHDVHLEAGIETPIALQLTSNEFIVRDFGHGISDENIQEIYTTYFNSSKAKQDSLTGGFGLGSKAPFAYTDHFVVESRHDGVKTTYALHVGDETTGGAPSICIMSSVKCEDSGLCVRVPIDADNRKFEEEIKDVVFFGGISATLNGEPLNSFDYTNIIENGSIGILPHYPKSLSASDYRGTFCVKIGAVIYPLDLGRIDATIGNWARNINSDHKVAIVLVAPPSLLSITPSREHLSYNERTVTALNKMLMWHGGLDKKSVYLLAEKIRMEMVRKYGRREYVRLYHKEVMNAELKKAGYLDNNLESVRLSGFKGLRQYLAVKLIQSSLDFTRDKFCHLNSVAARAFHIKGFRNKKYTSDLDPSCVRTLFHALQFQDVLRRFGRVLAKIDPKLLIVARYYDEGRPLSLNTPKRLTTFTGASKFKNIISDLARPRVTYASAFNQVTKGFVIAGGVMTSEEQQRAKNLFEKLGFDFDYIAPAVRKKPVRLAKSTNKESFLSLGPIIELKNSSYYARWKTKVFDPKYYIRFNESKDVTFIRKSEYGPPECLPRLITSTQANATSYHRIHQRIEDLMIGQSVAMCIGPKDEKRALAQGAQPIDVFLEKKLMALINPKTKRGCLILATMINHCPSWIDQITEFIPGTIDTVPASFVSLALRRKMNSGELESFERDYGDAVAIFVIIFSATRPNYLMADRVAIRDRIVHFLGSVLTNVLKKFPKPENPIKIEKTSVETMKKTIAELGEKSDLPGLLRHHSWTILRSHYKEVFDYYNWNNKRKPKQ